LPQRKFNTTLRRSDIAAFALLRRAVMCGHDVRVPRTYWTDIGGPRWRHDGRGSPMLRIVHRRARRRLLPQERRRSPIHRLRRRRAWWCPPPPPCGEGRGLQRRACAHGELRLRSGSAGLRRRREHARRRRQQLPDRRHVAFGDRPPARFIGEPLGDGRPAYAASISNIRKREPAFGDRLAQAGFSGANVHSRRLRVSKRKRKPAMGSGV
jgi:hypothetical protein